MTGLNVVKQLNYYILGRMAIRNCEQFSKFQNISCTC